jgi:hypothetical protein
VQGSEKWRSFLLTPSIAFTPRPPPLSPLHLSQTAVLSSYISRWDWEVQARRVIKSIIAGEIDIPAPVADPLLGLSKLPGGGAEEKEEGDDDGAAPAGARLALA